MESSDMQSSELDRDKCDSKDTEDRNQRFTVPYSDTFMLENSRTYDQLCMSLPQHSAIALADYAALLRKWQNAINLVSPLTLDSLETRHILDSWQLNAYIHPQTDLHIDLGSGAGFPALLIALFREQVLESKAESLLVESDQRKAQFLKVAIRTMQLKYCTVINDRVEKLAPIQADLITARAFASLETCFESTTNLRGKQSYFILPKGESAEQECQRASQKWSFQLNSVPSVTLPSASILIIHNLKKL